MIAVLEEGRSCVAIEGNPIFYIQSKVIPWTLQVVPVEMQRHVVHPLLRTIRDQSQKNKPRVLS